MKQKCYTKEFTVCNRDADICRRMKPSALLRCAEQIAAEHADADGIGESFLRPRGLAMLLGRQALRFYRMPMLGEKLTVTTRGEKSRRASVKRITTFEDEAGRQVAVIDARWIIVDTVKGRILREPTWDTSAFWLDEINIELPQAVHRPEEDRLFRVGTKTASYSICDENGHINNAGYLDIACDALPPEVFSGSNPIAFAALKYDREVRYGEQMEVFRAKSAQGWYVSGKKEGRNAFECYMEQGTDTEG